MAIVIPSKHIYSKSFDSVVYNNIDKIKVDTIVPNNIFDYNTDVYNKNYTEDLDCFLPDKYVLSGNSLRDITVSPVGYSYQEVIAYLNLRPAYTTISIKIPKKQKNKFINKIYDKENIKYSLAVVEKETINLIVNVFILDENGYPKDTNVYYEDSRLDFDNSTKTDITGIELKDYLEQFYTVTSGDLTKIVHISLDNLENISSISATYNEQDGTWDLLNLKILTSMYIAKAEEVENTYSADFPIRGQTRILEGTAEFYRAKQLSVTIYGDTINLDLQNKTISIGDGKQPYSFSGNELIQTTNTPNIESKYQNIIDKWENGKQTATITCPITDYYDTDGHKVINISTSGKMLFSEGDIVIPYAYTNKGDKPLSYNKDFTPKQFKVVGTKISKRQGGMQELTLQEV